MTNLVPRDSFFQDLCDFRRDFDQIFNRFLSWPSAREENVLTAGFAPAVESFIDKDGKKIPLPSHASRHGPQRCQHSGARKYAGH